MFRREARVCVSVESVNVACSMGTKHALVGKRRTFVEIRQMELVWSLERDYRRLIGVYGLGLWNVLWGQSRRKLLVGVFTDRESGTDSKIILRLV
jgi:hypothetical protein